MTATITITYIDQMCDIVDREVKAWKSDLAIDFQHIESQGDGQYLWATRNTGTDIVSVEHPEDRAAIDQLGITWFGLSMRVNDQFYLIDTRQNTVKPITRKRANAMVMKLLPNDSPYRRLIESYAN